MRQYELTYLISDNVPENELNKVIGKVGGYIKDGDGKLLKEEIWGRRKLAYPIKKLEFATYVTVNFEIPREKIKEFEHNIKMTGKIIRHLLIVKDLGDEELTLTKEDITETEDLKEVVGGEKSFESIEGMTEESRDLMAKREEKEEDDQEKETRNLSDKQTAAEPEKKREEPREQKLARGKEKKEEAAPEKLEKPKKESKTKKEKSTEKVEKTPKKEKAKKEDNEADRLSKLDKELDEILGEDL